MPTVIRQLHDAYDVAIGEHNNEYQFRVDITEAGHAPVVSYWNYGAQGLLLLVVPNSPYLVQTRRDLMQHLYDGARVRLYIYHEPSGKEMRTHFDSAAHFSDPVDQRRAFLR